MQLSDQTIELSDYTRIIARRKWHFLVPVVAILSVTTALAFLLPAVYRSEATILIQRQTIPQNIVASTVTGYVQEQIQQILQRITTHENLLQIANEFSLYPDERESRPQVAAQQIKENIEVEMLDVQASNPDQTGTRLATIAFTVAFNAENPATAKAVTEELSSRFLDVRRDAREALAAQVSEFLAQEVETIKAEISEYEKQLAGFKQGELRQLPELMGMNLQLYERTEQQIVQTEERIRAFQAQIDSVRAEMSLTPPYQSVVNEAGERILSASERLSMLTANYLQAISRYSAEHPDVIRLSREIRILAEQTGDSARTDELMGQLVSLQEQLRQARLKYGEGHPEITRLETAVAAVQRGFQTSLIAQDSSEQKLSTPPDNPRYVALKTQLESTESSLAAERERLTSLQGKLQEYEERLVQTPEVERDYKTISRGYEDALRKFSELTQKQQEAKIAQTLESGEGAEQWQLVSPAFLPSTPESPNRIGILLLGGLFAFAAGIGVVAIAEYLDKTVRNALTVVAILGAPPLAVIPRIEPGAATARR